MQFGSIPLPSPSGTASILLQDGAGTATGANSAQGTTFGAVLEAMAHTAIPSVDGQPVSPAGVDAMPPSATSVAEPPMLTSPQAQIDPAAVLPLLAQLQVALVALPPSQVAAASAGDKFGASAAPAADAASGGSPANSGEAVPPGGLIPQGAAAPVPAAAETGGAQTAPRFQTAEGTEPQASGRATGSPPAGSSPLGAVTAPTTTPMPPRGPAYMPAASPQPAGVATSRAQAAITPVVRADVEPGPAAAAPGSTARIAPETGAAPSVMGTARQFTTPADVPVTAPTTANGSPANGQTTPLPGMLVETSPSDVTGPSPSPAAPATAVVDRATGEGAQLRLDDVRSHIAPAKADAEAFAARPAPTEQRLQGVATDPSPPGMARARIEPEATDPHLPAVARAPSSAGVAPPHDAQTDTTEAGDMPPGLGAGQTFQSENLDPAAIVRRFVAGGEVTARAGQLRPGDPALPTQAVAQPTMPAQAIPQPSHPIASFAAQLADQAKPETGATPGTVAGIASAGKEPAGTAIADAPTPARLSDGLAGSEFRPEAGAALATTAPQRATATLQDVAAPSHPRAVPPHPATTQVAVSVARAVDDGVDRIAIKLQPPELGRIDVRLDFGADGRVQAMVLADRPATLEILRNDARELERALAGAGLETASGGLSFGLRQHANGNGQGGAQGFPAQPGRHPSDDAAPDEGRVPVPKHVLSAATGRLDIQV